MDLWQFYAQVEALIHDLRSASYVKTADRVERALRSGATSGEILGDLSVALPTVAKDVPGFASRSDELANWAREALA